MNFRKILKFDYDFKSISKLLSASTISQILKYFTAPILYRIYEQEDYGRLGLYMAITGILSILSTFEFHQVLLIEKEEKKLVSVTWLIRIINFSFAFLVFILAGIIYNQNLSFFGINELKVWIYFVPLSLFFSAQSQILTTLANRFAMYNVIATNNLLTAASIPIISISYGFIIDEPEGLLYGLLASQIIPTLILSYSLRNKTKGYLKGFNLLEIKQIFNQYKDFAIYTAPSELINRLSAQLPVFMLNNFVGIASVGIYNLCIRMLAMPISLIGSSITMVFKEKASKSNVEIGNFRKEYISTLKLLATTSLVPLVIVLLFAPDLFAFVFGENWRDSGVLAQLLIIMFIAKYIGSPLSYSFFIKVRLREDMILHIWLLLTNIITFLIGFNLTDNFFKVLFFYGINYTIFYGYYIVRSYKLSL